MSAPGHRMKLIRSTILTVLRGLRGPVPTGIVIDAVQARINAGDVRGVGIADRPEIRSAMRCMAVKKQIIEIAGPKLEQQRGRGSSRMFSRARPGSTRWAVTP